MAREEVATFPSSRGDATYFVHRDTTTHELSCTCPGWRFSPARGDGARTCKHVRSLGGAAAAKAAAKAGPVQQPGKRCPSCSTWHHGPLPRCYKCVEDGRPKCLMCGAYISSKQHAAQSGLCWPHYSEHKVQRRLHRLAQQACAWCGKVAVRKQYEVEPIGGWACAPCLQAKGLHAGPKHPPPRQAAPAPPAAAPPPPKRRGIRFDD